MAINGIEHALLHSLQWEQHDYDVADKKERWDLDEQEAVAVHKWMQNRITELLTLRDTNKKSKSKRL